MGSNPILVGIKKHVKNYFWLMHLYFSKKFSNYNKMVTLKLLRSGFFLGAHPGLSKVAGNFFLSGKKKTTTLFNLDWSTFLLRKGLLFFKKTIAHAPHPVILFVNEESADSFQYTEKTIKLVSKKKILLLKHIGGWGGGFLTNRLHPYFNVNKTKVLPTLVIVLRSSRYLDIINESKRLQIPCIGFVDSNMYPFFDYNIPLGIHFSNLNFFYNLFLSTLKL